MPYGRLQYNGDNQYTTKDKRNLLLTQETIAKINNITTGGIDAVVETRTHTPYATKTFAQLAALWDMDLVIEELNKAPIDYYNSLIDEGVLRKRIVTTRDITISEDGNAPRLINDYYATFWDNGMWYKQNGK